MITVAFSAPFLFLIPEVEYLISPNHQCLDHTKLWTGSLLPTDKAPLLILGLCYNFNQSIFLSHSLSLSSSFFTQFSSPIYLSYHHLRPHTHKKKNAGKRRSMLALSVYTVLITALLINQPNYSSFHLPIHLINFTEHWPPIRLWLAVQETTMNKMRSPSAKSLPPGRRKRQPVLSPKWYVIIATDACMVYMYA